MKKKEIQNTISLRQVFKESSFLFHVNFDLILTFILCVYGPLNLIRTVTPFKSLADVYGEPYIRLLLAGINLLNSFLGLVALIGIAFIVENSRKGEASSLPNTFRFIFSRLTDVFWTDVLSTLICFGLALLLVVPGIIWSIYYSFAPYIVSLRGIKGKAALDFSKRLVKGQAWKIFGIQMFIGIIAIGINFPILLLSRQVPELSFIYVFLPLTIFNIIGAFVIVTFAVLFLKVEHMKEIQKQNRIAMQNRT